MVLLSGTENSLLKTLFKGEINMSDLAVLSFSDLYAMYQFVFSDAARGFGSASVDARVVVKNKQKELEDELYNRIYGFNPFTKFAKSFTVKGQKPEDIDLNKFMAKKVDEEVPEESKKFAVIKGESK